MRGGAFQHAFPDRHRKDEKYRSSGLAGRCPRPAAGDALFTPSRTPSVELQVQPDRQSHINCGPRQMVTLKFPYRLISRVMPLQNRQKKTDRGLQPPGTFVKSPFHRMTPERGEVAEWSNAAVSKTVVGLRRPRVRIPVSPPLKNHNYLKVNEKRRSLPQSISPAHCGWQRLWRLAASLIGAFIRTGSGNLHTPRPRVRRTKSCRFPWSPQKALFCASRRSWAWAMRSRPSGVLAPVNLPP